MAAGPKEGSAQLPGPGPQRGMRAVEAQPAGVLAKRGPYYALVIGINDYRYLPKLKTAINDATAIADVLHKTYGFETKLLKNATRRDILTALSEYERNVPEDANLLIYYAGHGHFYPGTDKAYWLPADAERETKADWIIADDITSGVKAIPAKHILIVSDSCYSGGITRDVDLRNTPRDRDRYIQKMIASKSRTLMSSGGNEPVADGGGGGHSVFANAILHGLEQMDGDVFTAEELFHTSIRISVAGRSEQTPQYNPIRNSGHDDGDFVFDRRNPPAK